MPTLTACPLGETLPIAPGVCLSGTFDQASGCCFTPSAENVLEIPSVYVATPATPAPPRVVYSGNPNFPRGLPPSVAGVRGAGGVGAGGFASIIPVLVALLGQAFLQYLNKPATPVAPMPVKPVPTPPAPKTCAAGQFAQPCRPHEQIDRATGCCATICPAGEFAQPCRPNETVDSATNCCMLPAAPGPPAPNPLGLSSASIPNAGA